MTTKVYIIEEQLPEGWGFMEEFESLKQAKKILKSQYATDRYQYRIIKRTIKDEVVK